MLLIGKVSVVGGSSYGVRMFWCTDNARARLPSTPRWHSVVANATTEPQLASDELTELAVGDLDVRRRPPAAQRRRASTTLEPARMLATDLRVHVEHGAARQPPPHMHRGHLVHQTLRLERAP